jgi:CDP-diacylglycerol--glycerol-3-phosphate 3-phosphatidyltransferase
LVLVVPVVTLSIISEIAGILGVMVGGKRQYDGPMGKSDRAFTFSLISLLIALGITPGLWLDLVWIVMMGLLSWTIANRISSTLREVENNRVNSTVN